MKRNRVSTLKKWVRRWKSAGTELEKIRKKQIRGSDTRLAIELLDDAFRSALRLFPPKPTSGLVEQQKLLHRLKKIR